VYTTVLRAYRCICGGGCIIIIIIIIIIVVVVVVVVVVLGISFMQGIYTYIPETNHVPREHCVALILR